MRAWNILLIALSSTRLVLGERVLPTEQTPFLQPQRRRVQWNREERFVKDAWKEASIPFPRGGSFQRRANQIQLEKRPSRPTWWIFPVIVLLSSYLTFPAVSRNFDRLVKWVSEDSWLPDTPEKLSLLSNVVTQVVNGPVVTSISVLFATLMSVTISTLHSRQQDVQVSLINEIEALRNLQTLVSSPLYYRYLTEEEKLTMAERMEVLRNVVTEESVSEHSRPQKHLNPHEYIELQSDYLLVACDQIELHWLANPKRRENPNPLLTKIRELVQYVRTERKNRWIAVTSMHFPIAHYLTLGLLVVSILIAFLVATDEADFLFLQGLQVRVLWSVLVTCFSSLAVVCADLADAYSGAYAVATDFP